MKMIYVGTDNGAYISLDQGKKWNMFNNGLNKVAVHDLAIQKENKDLVGYHGRSIYKTDLSVIYSYLSESEIKFQTHYLNVSDINFSSRWGKRVYNWSNETRQPMNFSLVFKPKVY